ncbi:MAG: T9SS type A sorting domain-containing protein [Bacteroidota bacterium]
MKKALCLAGLTFACLLLVTSFAIAQTSWNGTKSTSWSLSSNWTNGVPTATTDAVIGDASFTGSYQPSVSSAAYCRNLQIGGTKASTLNVLKNFTITGSLTLNSNGTLTHTRGTITVQSNWTNNGAYSALNNNAIVAFGGVAATLGGTTATVFRRMKINAGSVVTLASNISSSGGSNYVYVYGTLNPGQTTQYSVTASSALTVFSAGILKVNAATLAANYVPTPVLNAGSIVDYSSTTLNQTVSALTYSTLKISGSTTKTLGGSLAALNSSTAANGNIYVTSGTLDLAGFTANRGTTVAGGNLNVLNGATLRIGGTNTFPTNYASIALSLTSTTEYYGTTQTVAAQTYGNLKLSSSSGVAAKSGSATNFTISGNLVTTIGAGTGVTFTAGSNITVSGHDSIGVSTTFSGGAFAHVLAGNWVNAGTFTGSTSTVTMTGAGSTISGAGTQNFNNLNIAASNMVASSATINISGNFATTGSGTFTQSSGTMTLSGASKTISGSGISLNTLSVSGSVTTTSSLTISGDMITAGTLSASAGYITLTGTAKSISGAGSTGFYGLLVPGTITTSANISVASALDVSGSMTATAGTTTFTGSATLNGTANLFNVTLNATSLVLSTNSILGISNAFTITAGTLNVTTAIPNTVSFNGAGAQNIPAATFDRLTLANGGTKTAIGNVNTNGIFTINSGVTFNAASYTHSLQNNFINNGSFTPGASIMSFTGTKDATITGPTTFNELRLNKSSSANVISLTNNATAALVTMTSGVLKTGANTLTITNTRTGNGIIFGNIKRTHAYTTGVAYAFESPDNSITFSSVSSVTTITVSVSQATIADFPYGAAVNRLYNITVPAGTYTATVRLHYTDAELNGNDESSIFLWNYNGSAWANKTKSANNTTSNYVEQTGLTNITNRWGFSGEATVLRWSGAVSSSWTTPGNWTAIQGAPGSIPGAYDVVQIGQSAITNQPTISTAVAVKNIEFGSVAAATLTLGSGGSLLTSGNIGGTWTTNATHTISVGAQSLTVNGSIDLTDGTTAHAINLNASTGTITIHESLVQGGGANVTLSGSSALHIGEGFIYSSGTFSAGTSTVYYDGSQYQQIGGVNYYNLTVTKSNGIASIDNALAVGGNMTVTGGVLNLNANTTVAGSVVIGSGATITFNDVTMSIGGDLNNSGNFIPGSGTISFTGSGNQLISLATFNNIIINKPSGATNFTGSIDVYGNFSILSGNIDIGSYTANRTSAGGVFTLAAGASLTVSGSSNFPSNYSSNLLDVTSTVTYNGTGTQVVNGVGYGNLVLNNGGSNAKTLAGHTNVNGNLTINSGATLSGSAYNLSLSGDWTNSGTFAPSTGAVLLMGTSKTVTGATTFNKLTIYGTYSVAGSNIIYNGLVNVIAGASYNGGSGVGTVNGDLINSGTLISTGTTTFSGTTVQTIRLLSPIQSTAAGIINFNGTVAPILNSTATPQYATVNINNTGGVTASVNWGVAIAFNVASGATFNGGVSTHYFHGSFVNNGIVTSAGTLNFSPTTAKTYTIAGTGFSSTGTVRFGGSAPIAVTGTPTLLTDVIIANTSGVSPSNNWNISGNFTINSDAVFNAGSYSYSVGGDMESNGTLNGGTSTFTMNGTGVEISGSPNTTFYNYTVTGTVTANVDFNVSNNFTNNNSFDASIGSVVMTGSGPGIIGGTASPFILSQADIAKTGTATVTLANSLVDVINLDIRSGVLNASTFGITQHTEGGSLFIKSLATLQIGGTNSLPAFDSYEIDSLSTVEYNGGMQTIASLSSFGSNYGNLVISTSGTKWANGALKILNNFTLANGSFTPGSYIDTLCGNWTMTSGSLNSSGTTLVLTGGGAQTLSSTGAFNNITVNKVAGTTDLLTNISMAGTLTITKGIISTGVNTLALTSSLGTVTGASQATGWVNGKIQKFIPMGMPARSFEVGGSTMYSPATVTFAFTSSIGNLSVGVTDGEHSDIANSGINNLRNVNRYFSMVNTGVNFSTATVALNWVAADVDAGSTTANFKVKSLSGGIWTLNSVASPLATSIQATSVASFGDFVIGEAIVGSSWTGNSSTAWNTAGNWSAGVPTASTNITVPGGRTNYPIITTAVSGLNVTINSGATITVTGGVLSIYGVTTNSGKIIATLGGVSFVGNTAQQIPAALFQNNTVKDLVINNPAGVTINDTLGVSGVLTLSSGQLSTGGHLTLLSSADGTARVAQITGGSISGNVTVERYNSNHRAWKLLTLPLHHSNSIFNSWQNSGVYTPGKGTFISGPSPDPLLNGLDYSGLNNVSMKTFNAATQAFGDISNTQVTSLSGNIKDSSDNIGYFIFIRGDRNTSNLSPGSSNATTLSGTGKLQTGAQYFPASPVMNGYTLIGNPYASPIDFNLLAKTNLVNRFFVWDPSLNQVGGYVAVDDIATPGVYTASPSSAQTQVIQSGQAFFVVTQNNGAASIGFNESSKSASSSNSMFRPVSGSSVVSSFRTDLFLDNAGSTSLADGALVQFKNEFSAGVNYQDADKFGNVNETIGMLRSGRLLAIERKPPPTVNDTLFFKLTKTTARKYQFVFTAENMDTTGLSAYLEDSYTKTQQPLNLVGTSKVSFTVINNAASMAANRFRVVFKMANVLPVTYTSVKAKKQNQHVAVEWKVEHQENIKEYQVERSADGSSFAKVHTALPVATPASTYSWLDESPVNGSNFYRIRNVDRDGKVQYSNVVEVTMASESPAFSVYPNPVVDNTIGLKISNLSKGTYHLNLINMAGQVLFTKTIQHVGGSNLQKIATGVQLSTGMYQLEILDAAAAKIVLQVHVGK